MASKVDVKDSGMLRKFMRTVRDAEKGVKVTVGVQGEQAAAPHPNAEITNAELALIHEFGAPMVKIPERSFLRATWDENVERYRHIVSKGARRAAYGTTSMKAVMFQVGETIRADVINRIRSGIEPPNSDRTIARKGSSTPLIDKGYLLGSISSVVKEGGR